MIDLFKIAQSDVIIIRRLFLDEVDPDDVSVFDGDVGAFVLEVGDAKRTGNERP